MPRIAVIIPAKNEGRTIDSVIEDIGVVLPEADVVVINDNSNDGTAEAVKKHPGINLLSSPITLGIGGAVQLGIKYCFGKGYDAFVRMDGDGQHRADSVPELIKNLKANTLVLGSRPRPGFTTTSTFFRKFASMYFSLLFKIFLGKKVSDPTSGLICFGPEIAEKFIGFYPADFPEIESEVLLLRAGYNVLPVEVKMRCRQGGISSIDLLHSLVYIFSVSIAFFISFVRQNPYDGNCRTS